MPKLLYLIKNMSLPGGTERATAMIANELVGKGYEVTILSICGHGKSFFELDHRIKTHVLFKGGREDMNHYRYFFAILWRYFWFLKKLRPQVVIDISRPMSLFSMPFRSCFRYKVITWEHFNYQVIFSIWSKWAQKIVMRYTDMLVCLTKEDREIYTKVMSPSRVIYINNAITIYSDESPMTEKILLNVGRASFQKGHDLLLQAWKLLEDKRGWKLQIVAGGKSTWRSKLEKMIEDMKMSDSVELLPPQKDMVSCYKKASIFVLSSRFEGLPFVVIESLFMGLPLITFDTTSTISSLLKKHNSGIVCPPANITKLSRAIQDMIHDDSLRMEKAKNARQSVQDFLPGRISEQWDRLLKKVS